MMYYFEFELKWSYDESKTHMFLSPFFLHFLEFNVQFNANLWNIHPDFVLQGYNAKETKTSKKMAKAGDEDCRNISLR